MGVGARPPGCGARHQARWPVCGSEECLGFGWAGRGQECGCCGQAARTRITLGTGCGDVQGQSLGEERKGRGWARIDAGDLVLRFQGLGLKNQGNWQQGNSGHGGVRQNLNDGPWGVPWDGRHWPDPGEGQVSS